MNDFMAAKLLLGEDIYVLGKPVRVSPEWPEGEPDGWRDIVEKIAHDNPDNPVLLRHPLDRP